MTSLIEYQKTIDLGDVKSGTVEFLLPLKNLTDSTVNLKYEFSCGCTSGKQIPTIKGNESIEVPMKISKHLKKRHWIHLTIRATQGLLVEECKIQVTFNYI